MLNCKEYSLLLDNSKVSLGEQQLLLTEKTTAALNGSYLQIVGHDNIYVDKQTLPKLIDARFSGEENTYTTNKSNDEVVKTEDDNSSIHRDSDGENRLVFCISSYLIPWLNGKVIPP